MDLSASPEADFIPLDSSAPASNVYLQAKRRRQSPSRESPQQQWSDIEDEAHSDRGPPTSGLASGHGYERLRPPGSGPPTTSAATIQETVEAKKAPYKLRAIKDPVQTTQTDETAADSDAESAVSVASVATHDSVPVASIAATELAKSGRSSAFVYFAGLQATPLDEPLASHHLQDHRYANVLIDLFAGSGSASHGIALGGVTPDIHIAVENDPVCRGVFRTHFPRAALFRSFEATSPERIARTLEATLAPFIEERREFAEAERAFNPEYTSNPFIVVTVVGGPPCPPFSRVQGPKAVQSGQVANTLLGKTFQWLQRLRQMLPPGIPFGRSSRASCPPRTQSRQS